MLFVTWIGWTVIIIIGVALLTAIQQGLACALFGEPWDADTWFMSFCGTLILAAIIWFPATLGWFISASGV